MSDAADRKIERMLLWFESQLPRHELGLWRLEARPSPAFVLDEDTRSIWHPHDGSSLDGTWNSALLRGTGSCVRCGKAWDLNDSMGNFRIRNSSQDERLGAEFPSLTLQGVVARAQDYLRDKAARDGACWGDVPKPDRHRFVAVADSAHNPGSQHE